MHKIFDDGGYYENKLRNKTRIASGFLFYTSHKLNVVNKRRNEIIMYFRRSIDSAGVRDSKLLSPSRPSIV